jgi:hypothetical protein
METDDISRAFFNITFVVPSKGVFLPPPPHGVSSVRKVVEKSWNFGMLKTGPKFCAEKSATEYSLTPRYIYEDDKVLMVAYFLELDSHSNSRVCSPENFENFLYH